MLYPFEPPISGCVYHEITPIARGLSSIFKVEVFVDGLCVGVDDETGESFHEGGKKVATLFRRTENDAIASAIRVKTTTLKGE